MELLVASLFLIVSVLSVICTVVICDSKINLNFFLLSVTMLVLPSAWMYMLAWSVSVVLSTIGIN